MHHRDSLTRLLVALATVGALASCSAGSVEVAIPTRAAQCPDMDWPLTVADAPRRTTDPSAPQVAAWSDPAIVARCGLSPVGPTTDPCIVVDGVDWIARPLSDGTALITYGTDPAIEVLVPQDYAPAPLLLPAFTAAAKSLPRTGRRCN